MAVLFLIYAIVIVFLGLGFRKTAIVITLINLISCLAMFWHHITDVLHILL